MCELAKKEHDEAVAQVYEFLRNLLGGDPQAQWDHICREMHECDSWASLTSAKNEGKCPRTSETQFKPIVNFIIIRWYLIIM